MRKLALVAAGLMLAALASPAQALEPQDPRALETSGQYIPDGLYRVAYTGEIWQVENFDGGGYTHALTFEEYSALEDKSFKPAPTDYVKYPWSQKLYGVTFFGSNPESWLWDPLTLQQWQAAGSPAPRNAGYIKGSEIFKFSGSSELFLEEDTSIYGEESEEEILASIPAHKLTFNEWAATGFRGPVELTAEIKRLSWDSSGAIFIDYNGYGDQLTLQEYQSIGSPTPQVVAHLPGDNPASYSVYRQENPADARLVYYNGNFDYKKILTFNEWNASGRPTPGSPVGSCSEADAPIDDCNYWDASIPELALE
ncbi:hypothetical protein [Aeromicrobium sp. Leaf350]|uniref:hypothetical protein n=1 Tax=Aeromicrobium sp. Leaf350 TaxID=2876565 RepID=UPI001E54BAB6|nr:hypothetical protein [Aeromicrobium sp. Leaf350]